MVVLLVLLEYTSALGSAINETKKKQIVVIKTENDKKKSAIFQICKDEYLSVVFANSKYPYLLTAIAKVESDFRPQIVGDGGKSYGMYQIQSKHWGYVPESVEGQTRKAEQVISHLIQKHGLRRGITAYNGSGKQASQYTDKVLRVVRELHQIERRV